jgi:uncharacterized protein DUF6923
MRRFTGGLVALVLLLASPMLLHAAPIIWIDDSSGNIGKVDVATGAVSGVKATSQALTDIAFDPSGQLYGVTFDSLYKIDKSTGATTLVGSLGNAGTQFNALVFGKDGTLYTAAANSTSLYTVNTGTGAATALAGTLPTASAGDLAFHGSNLFMAGSNGDLIKIALTPTVSGTDKGSFGLANVFGLVNAGGNLYAVAGTKVYTVDPTDGATALAADYTGDVQGLGDANGAAAADEVLVGSAATAAAAQKRQAQRETTLTARHPDRMAGFFWLN